MTPKKASAAGSRVGVKKKRTSSGKPTIPTRIFAHASPLSVGGVSLFEGQHQIHAATVANFFSEEEIVRQAAQKLHEAGFEILQVSPTTINIAGTEKTYREAFNTRLKYEERPVVKSSSKETTATFVEAQNSEFPGLISTKGTPFEQLLEGVALEQARYVYLESVFPPMPNYWHLRMPGDVSLGVNADKAHRSGITGRGIKVAMVDTGHYKHPYFLGRGYNISPVTLGPGTTNPLDDEFGHGTGESANVFAVAPDVTLMPVKAADPNGNLVNTVAAFNAAVGLGPDIITCSWGSSVQTPPLSASDQALSAAVATAVASGIIVVFSAGNGSFGFPGQHPDVISAGGTFMNQDGTFTASNFASGFASQVFPGRNVPDLCGLVGMQPLAIYIMLPIQAGDTIDVQFAGKTFPNGDETAANDGWGVFSGTSAAAPQLAGVCALIKQACPKLSPASVKDILMRTARDVTTGNCSPSTGGFAAGPGADLATGTGLVDAQKAVLTAKIRCITFPPIAVRPTPPIGVSPEPPFPPITVRPPTVEPPIVPPILPPVTPVLPIQPVLPVKPIVPVLPVKPIVPVLPVKPIVPIEPVKPILPVGPPILPPVAPVVNPGPAQPASGQSTTPQQQPVGLTAEDVATIEEMIGNSEIDIDT
jgi:subtilisin family serine protease